jgi:hypothetical protein
MTSTPNSLSLSSSIIRDDNIRDCRAALIAQLLLWLHSLEDAATSTTSITIGTLHLLFPGHSFIQSIS